MGTSKLLILLLALGGGSGNELLDYLPSALYWKIKKVEVSAGTMLAELAPHPKADRKPTRPPPRAEPIGISPCSPPAWASRAA